MTKIEKADILTRRDIELLVDSFYGKILADEFLGPVFSHVDWTVHKPIMYDFWSSMILGEQSYRGNPFQKHVSLPLEKSHFSVWLTIFNQTVDENFYGATAEEIKERARHIANVFQFKLGLLKES